MKTLRLSFICSMLCSIYNISHAQDVHFSQFNEVPQLLNPALTASTHDLRASLNYKDQWRSVTTPYKTYSASIEAKLDLLGWAKIKGKTGFFTRSTENAAGGIFFYRDVAGDGNLGTTKAGLSLSTTVDMSENSTVSMGLSGAYGQYSINYTALSWSNQFNGMSYDPTLPSGENFQTNRFAHFDVAAGMHWHYGKGERYMRSNDKFKANAGLGVYHVNKPRYSFLGDRAERLAMKYVLSGGLLKGFKNTNFDIAPSFMMAVQGPARELIVGTLFKYNLRESSKYTGFIQSSTFSIGTFYRNKDAFILSTLYEFGNYAVGFSYDINMSRLSSASTYRGGFEVALRFQNPNPFLYQNKPRI
jgi:type IX secretion system PorP/SprF family membrane protein